MLHIVHYSGSVEAAEVLIKAGAGVNTKGYNGNTPLILAADRGHTGIAKLLLNHPTIKVHEVVCENSNDAGFLCFSFKSTAST